MTLVELLIVLVMLVLLTSALSMAFSAELKVQARQESNREHPDLTDSTEDQITQLIESARLTTIRDRTSYFAGIASRQPSDLGCERLTFTTTAPGVPMSAWDSQDSFDQQQYTHGPVGGLTEISLSTTAVGDPGSKVGLFERVQHPSDFDPTQGGFEHVLDREITAIGFKFWDGSQWVSTWDSTSGNYRLPEAVRVSYKKNGQPLKRFTVNVFASDVNEDNPVSESAEQ